MTETPIWDAMLAEYGDPTREIVSVIPTPSEHPIFDEMRAGYSDPLIAYVDPLIGEISQ
jgi:hypothetical protein